MHLFVIILLILTTILLLWFNNQADEFRLDTFVQNFCNSSEQFCTKSTKEQFWNFFKQEDPDPKKLNQIVTYHNKKWIVQQPDSAKMLDMLITRINKLIDNIKQHPDPDFTLTRLRYWDNTFVLENIKESWKNDSTSYSINKGEQLVFCIRDKLNNSIHDINTLMFVAIHELAHIVTNELQHTEKFWNNMKKLLQRAEDIGLYHYVDYRTNPVEYCGMMIDSAP